MGNSLFNIEDISINKNVEQNNNSISNNKDRGDGSIDVVKYEHLTHIFNKGKNNEYKLFEDFSLTFEDKVNDHQSISLMGPSGCGKSFLLKILTGLNNVQEGTVKIYDKPLSDYGNIPMCFQQPGLYPWLTVIEQVMLPMQIKGISKENAKVKALELLNIVGLSDKINEYPSQLSGGQAQRCNLARSLASNVFNNNSSYLLLLDECTSALDIKMKRDVQNVILDILYSSKVDPTIISVTHNIEEALFISNKIIIMQSNPCKVYKTLDIHYEGEGDGPGLKRRGDWIFNTEEYAKYYKELTEIMNNICK